MLTIPGTPVSIDDMPFSRKAPRRLTSLGRRGRFPSTHRRTFPAKGRRAHWFGPCTPCERSPPVHSPIDTSKRTERRARAPEWQWRSCMRRLAIPALALAVLLCVPLVRAQSQAGVIGQWTTLSYQMTINPVHLALLRNGKVLVVSGSGNVPTETNFQRGSLGSAVRLHHHPVPRLGHVLQRDGDRCLTAAC